jgi:hypothetical protein
LLIVMNVVARSPNRYRPNMKRDGILERVAFD